MAKSAKLATEAKVLSPSDINPTTPADYLQRGWLFLSSKNPEKALVDFDTAIQQNPDNPDAYYALALALKALGKNSEAVEKFNKVLSLIGESTNQSTRQMLTRLIHGHINQINSGDWNLEKEIWQRR